MDCSVLIEKKKTMSEHGGAEKKKRIYVSKFALCFQGADNLKPRLSFLVAAKEREPGFEVEKKGKFFT